MPRFNRIVFIIFIVLTAPGIILSVLIFARPFNHYRTETVGFRNDRQDTVEGILYIPLNDSDAKCPALVSVHYGLQNREALQPAARVLAENGIVVMDLLLKKARKIDGKRKSFEDYLSDVKAAADYMLSIEYVDTGRVFLSGHSIGANVTSMVARSHSGVAGEIAVGYPVEYLPGSSSQLLMTAGIFDELHPVSKMLDAFLGTVGKKTTREILIRNSDIPHSISKEKTNRIYFISFLTDHYIEPLDPDITRASLHFIKSLGGEQAARGEILHGVRAQILTRSSLFFSVYLLFFLSFIEITGVPTLKAPAGTFRKILLERMGIVAFLLLYLILWLVHSPAEHLIHIYVLSAMFLAVLSSNLFVRKAGEWHIKGGAQPQKEDAEKITRFFIYSLVKVVFYIFAFYAAYILGLFVHAGIYPYSKLCCILHTLWGPAFLIPAQLYVFCTRINGLFLTSDFTFNTASLVPWVILIGELVHPGVMGKILDEFFSRVVGSIQKLDFKIKFKSSSAEIVLFGVVLIVCVVLWRQILSEGYAFGFAELLGMGYLFFSFIVIPLAAFTLIIRSKRAKEFLDEYLPAKLKIRPGGAVPA
ncbi:MAG: hypothetical protein RDV48_02620 [Candidatus Eremiobacteraeota bacterium]|nr:hypothetical protein [Candidatus Eremiobacteraeota bacterium]